MYDDPAKTLDTENRTDELLLTRLLETVGHPATQFELISPYFVPMAEGASALEALAGRGVNVRVLTNALESTDVSAVHAGYAKRRKDLLRAGIRLYELKRGDVPKPTGDKKIGGSSSASLHAKTFQIDGNRMFVGSFNFDPRSAKLNTEMGLVIDSPAMAQQFKAFVRHRAPASGLRSPLDRQRQPSVDRAHARRRENSRHRAGYERLAPRQRWLPIHPADRVAAVSAAARP